MKSLAKPVRDGGAEGRTGDWGEVVTRYPYENVGMDHLLSMEKFCRKEKSCECFEVSMIKFMKSIQEKL